MTQKRFTYLDTSRNKYIGSFFCNGIPLTNLEVVDLLNENEHLKKQLASINRLIDNKIDEFKKGDYGDLPCNTIHMFLDLKQELGDLK